MTNAIISYNILIMSTKDQNHYLPADSSTNEEGASKCIGDISNSTPVHATTGHEADFPTEDVVSESGSENHPQDPSLLSTKVTRRFRTTAEKAYDQAVKEKEKAINAVQVAFLRLQVEQREAKYQTGIKMMHSVLLQATQSVREGAFSVMLGMADDNAQSILQEYLTALNSAPSKPDQNFRNQ